MTILLWWSLASVVVSVFIGAFLAFARHEPETLELDLIDLRPFPPDGAAQTADSGSDLAPVSPPATWAGQGST